MALNQGGSIVQQSGIAERTTCRRCGVNAGHSAVLGMGPPPVPVEEDTDAREDQDPKTDEQTDHPPRLGEKITLFGLLQWGGGTWRLRRSDGDGPE